MSETEKLLKRLKTLVKGKEELEYGGELLDTLRDLNNVGKGGELPLDPDVNLESFKENYPRFFNPGVAGYVRGIIESLTK